MAEVIDKHRTILLIGNAQTKYKVGQVSYFTSVPHMAKAYGSCEISESFALLKSFDCPHVFVYNTGGDRDLSGLATAIRDYDFTYVVPVDIKLSDSYYDRSEGKELLVCGTLLNAIGPYGLSTIIMTDNSASLYEDVDTYLKEMTVLESRISGYLANARSGHNLIFVGDVLTAGMTHVRLAASMCMTSIQNYPGISEEWETVFDIDILDVGRHSLVYFRRRMGRTTIENLVNFHEKLSPERMADVDRVLKYIIRELDFSSYQGVTYSDSVRLKAEAYLRGFLQRQVGVTLESFDIDDVWFKLNSGTPGAGSLYTKFSVRPLGCSANCTLKKEV